MEAGGKSKCTDPETVMFLVCPNHSKNDWNSQNDWNMMGAHDGKTRKHDFLRHPY